MARKPRPFVPGAAMHVVQRGNNRQATFFDERDYGVYLEALAYASEAEAVPLHAYVLMTNHVHLLVTPPRAESLSRFMQALSRCYVRYVNRTYRRTGTLWEGRFKAGVVGEPRYLMTCMLYIDKNPVRAGMVAEATGYDWSSARRLAQGAEDLLVTPHPAYLDLAANAAGREAEYDALLQRPTDLRDLKALRQATQQNAAYGSNRFQDQIEAMIGRRMDPQPRGRPAAEP